MRYEFDRERLDELLDRWVYVLAGRLIADVAQGETAEEALAHAVQLFPEAFEAQRAQALRDDRRRVRQLYRKMWTR